MHSNTIAVFTLVNFLKNLSMHIDDTMQGEKQKYTPKRNFPLSFSHFRGTLSFLSNQFTSNHTYQTPPFFSSN